MTSFELNNNKAIEVDGIRFETIMSSSSVPVPTISKKQKLVRYLRFFLKRPLRSPLPFTSVQMGIRITNKTSIPWRFSFYCTLIPSLIGEDRQNIPRDCISNRLILAKESDFPLVMPMQSVTFFPQASLRWQWDDYFILSFSIGDEGYYKFGGLKLGSYQIQFSYKKWGFSIVPTASGWEPIERRFPEKVWTGRVDLPPTEFCLVQ